jgi:hypothetical protein
MTLRKRPWLFVIGGVIAIMIFPSPKVFVGEWLVRVIDQNGAPVSGIRVSQSWESYTYRLSGGEDLYTDSQGKVIFPRKSRFAPNGYWLIKATLNVLGFGVHASFGSFGRVWIADPRLSDPSLRESLLRNPKAIELLADNCSNVLCTSGTRESQLRLPT